MLMLLKFQKWWKHDYERLMVGHQFKHFKVTILSNCCPFEHQLARGHHFEILNFFPTAAALRIIMPRNASINGLCTCQSFSPFYAIRNKLKVTTTYFCQKMKTDPWGGQMTYYGRMAFASIRNQMDRRKNLLAQYVLRYDKWQSLLKKMTFSIKEKMGRFFGGSGSW